MRELGLASLRWCWLFLFGRFSSSLTHAAPRSPGSGLRTSPVAIPAPSKPCFVFSRIVGIEIDVQARNSAIPKLEQVAETSAWGLAACPGFPRHFAVRSSFNRQVVAERNESQTFIIVSNVFQGPFESLNHFEKRLLPKSKSKFWEINFSIFVEKLEDVRATLVTPYEIFVIV
jgi:hypothetical protein